ncbi:MAG: GTPase Era [Myxococcales bacterium]|nr:GTPase Era [Myxococcales bacterium]
MSTSPPPTTGRSGSCAIVGRANVGKSTLLNALLGQKLAIATPKPQTTRNLILGLYTRAEPPLQIALLDTPGLHRPGSALGRALLEDAKGGLMRADVVLLMLAVDRQARIDSLIGPEERVLLQGLEGDGRPLILAINKVDRVGDKSLLLPLLEQLSKLHDFAAMVPISARRGSGLDPLIDAIGEQLPEGLRYDPEQVTDRPERFFAAEFVREAVIEHTQQEVPYSVAVVVDSFRREQGLVRIEATVVVDKPAHKGILIGKGGQRLKAIGSDARRSIEEMLEERVFLKLWVKVTRGWTDDPARVKEWVAEAGGGTHASLEVEPDAPEDSAQDSAQDTRED